MWLWLQFSMYSYWRKTVRTRGRPLVAMAWRTRCSPLGVNHAPAQSRASATPAMANASGNPRWSHEVPGNSCMKCGAHVPAWAKLIAIRAAKRRQAGS